MARKLKAASTHYPNMGEPEIGKGDQEMLNHQGAGVLLAPDPVPGFSTHKAQTASVKGKKGKQTAVSLSDLGTDLESDLDNYAPAMEDEDDLELENSGESSDLELPEEEFTAELEDDEDDEGDEDDMDDPADDLDDPEDQPEERVTVETDVMDVVDVDDMPEEVDESEINVAPLEASLLVLRGNRVIATMTEEQAEEEGVKDEFQSDEFASVVASVCATKGLRRGLADLGFTMATVDLGASHVVAAQVKARAEQASKRLTASFSEQSKSLEACLSLAAVGINKGFWKDVPNPLKASVEASLLRAGVQNPKTMTSKLFASAGIEYAKAMVTVAQRLAAMPEATRNTLAEALDFTNDQIEEDEDLVEGEAEDVEMDDTDFQDVDASTIEAALARPGRKQVASLLQHKTPVTARAILEGSSILEF